MAFTQADLDAIDRTIAAGVLTVRTHDRLVTYQSREELMATRAAIVAELTAQSASPAVYPRHQLASFAD